MTPYIAQVIRDNTHHVQYDLECPAHPAALCGSDYSGLMKVKQASDQRVQVQGKSPLIKWSKLDLGGFVVPESGVGVGDCSCPMCRLGQFNPVGKTGRKCTLKEAVMSQTGDNLELQTEPVQTKVRKKVRCSS